MHVEGYHTSLNFRTMSPKMFMQLFPGLISYVDLPHRVVLPDKTIEIKHHGVTQLALKARRSYETGNPVPLENFSETKQASLGSVAHGRSGDKGDNCNIRLFARNAHKYQWLRSSIIERFPCLNCLGSAICSKVTCPGLFASHMLPIKSALF